MNCGNLRQLRAQVAEGAVAVFGLVEQWLIVFLLCSQRGTQLISF